LSMTPPLANISCLRYLDMSQGATAPVKPAP